MVVSAPSVAPRPAPSALQVRPVAVSCWATPCLERRSSRRHHGRPPPRPGPIAPLEQGLRSQVAQGGGCMALVSAPQAWLVWAARARRAPVAAPVVAWHRRGRQRYALDRTPTGTDTSFDRRIPAVRRSAPRGVRTWRLNRLCLWRRTACSRSSMQRPTRDHAAACIIWIIFGCNHFCLSSRFRAFCVSAARRFLEETNG